MNKPSIKLFELLISLYADQNGVQVSYELKKEKQHESYKS